MTRPTGNPLDIYINQDRVVQRYVAQLLGDQMQLQIAEFYAASSGIDEVERAKQLDELDAQLLQAELVEEGLIRSAENGGFAMSRRRDADVRAVLAPIQFCRSEDHSMRKRTAEEAQSSMMASMRKTLAEQNVTPADGQNSQRQGSARSTVDNMRQLLAATATQDTQSAA